MWTLLCVASASALHLHTGAQLRPATCPPARDVRMGPSPKLKELVMKVMTDHESITFAYAIDAVESNYDIVPVPFSVGSVESAAGENMGSAKILSAGKMLMLSSEVTLWLFGEIYRDVLNTPEGIDHPNIRAFMEGGWDAVSFPDGLCLRDKAPNTIDVS